MPQSKLRECGLCVSKYLLVPYSPFLWRRERIKYPERRGRDVPDAGTDAALGCYWPADDSSGGRAPASRPCWLPEAKLPKTKLQMGSPRTGALRFKRKLPAKPQVHRREDRLCADASGSAGFSHLRCTPNIPRTHMHVHTHKYPHMSACARTHHARVHTFNPWPSRGAWKSRPSLNGRCDRARPLWGVTAQGSHQGKSQATLQGHLRPRSKTAPRH